MDKEPLHMQTHLDSKLSLMEIKNVAEIIDSTEGTLKIPEDQILVEAASEIKLPSEDNLNGTTFSLNGHMDEESKISNDQLHEGNNKDREQIEATLDMENTCQNNKEVNDCLRHGEATTEDSLLKNEKEEEHNGDDQQDEDPLKTDSGVDQSQIAIDRLDSNLDPAKATEDTQTARMVNIPDVGGVAEAKAGVLSPLNSDAILDTIDGSTEKDKSTREDGAIHLEHRESFPENTSTAKHTEEVVKAEDQQSKQDDSMDADVVREDITKYEETGVSQVTPKSEHANESTEDTQEVLHQEHSGETNGPAYEKKKQTSQQNGASDDSISEYDATTCEPPVGIQVQNKESLEEIEDAEAVDTKAEMQQSCAVLEEAIPEYHAAATKQDSVETSNTEISETHNEKIAPSSEDKVESNVAARGPTCGGQEVDNAGSTEEIVENNVENIVLVSNADTIDEANKENNMLRAEDVEKHMWGIEPEVTKDTELVQTEEASDQRHVCLLDDSAQEDNTSVSKKQQMESALETNETEATRDEAVPKESNASVSEEPSLEYATENETTHDAKEVNTTESLEAVEGDKDTQTREISSQSNMGSAGKSTQENNAPESETTSDIQPEQDLELEEMTVIKLVQLNEISSQINSTITHNITQNNPTTSELHVMEAEGGVSNIEATEEQVAPHELAGDHSEEKAIEEIIISNEPQTVESVEKMNDIEAHKPQSVPQQSIISPSEESVSKEIAKEDIVTIKPDDGHQQPQDPELELNEIETNKSHEIVSSSIVSNHQEPISEDNVTVIEPNPETQAENLQSTEVMEDTENKKSHGVLAGEAAQEENVGTEASVDISSVQEPELEETKNTEPVGTDDDITSSDLPAERMEKETVEIEGIPHESPVTSITEVTENDLSTAIAPHASIQPVLEQESLEDKCTATTKNLRETHKIVGPASDELTPTEDNMTMVEPACDAPLQNVIAQGTKDSEDAQTDQLSNLDNFPTPGEAAEESKLPRVERTSDVPEVQKLVSAEETECIKAVETKDHQQHIVSTVEEPAVDNKAKADHQVHEEKPAELKDNEAMEGEQVLEKCNFSTPDNALEERSELRNDPDYCVQPVQQVESSRDSEDSKILKAKETSEEKFNTLKDKATEDVVADEINSPVDMEQEHGLDSVEEVKEINVTKAKQNFLTSQPEALDKLTSEMRSTEGINDEDISCEQTEVAASVDPSPKDNEIAPQEHFAEPHEENLGNETYKAVLAQGIKGELQTSAEQDDALDLGETAPTKKSKNIADEDAIQSSSEDTLESSKSTDQIKEGQNDEIKHNSSEHHRENLSHVQDKVINGEPITERDIAEAFQTLIENDAQASQDVMEKDDTIKSDEKINAQMQSSDAEHRPQTCESSAEYEVLQKVSLDEGQKKDEEVEARKQQLLADEQKHKDESDDVSNKPLVESKSIENRTTKETEETDTLEAGQTEAVANEILKNGQALYASEESTPSTTDITVDDITGTDKSAEEETRPNSANTSDADAKMDNQENKENTGKDNIVPMDSTGEKDETIDEITIEEDPIDIPYNVESGEHEDKECTNKVNDDLPVIQSETETVAGTQETKGIQNEAKAIHAESQTKTDEEMSQLQANEPYNLDSKMDDRAHEAEIIHDNITVQPTEIEEMGENKGISSINKPVVETSEQNNVEQDLSIHHEAEDEKLESTEENAVELEATQERIGTSNVDTNNDDQLPISSSLKKHVTESADDVLQLEIEGNAFDKVDGYEKTEASNKLAPETVTFSKEICDKVTGAEGGLPDETLETFDDTRRNLDASSVVTVSNEESIDEDMEEQKLVVPAHPTMAQNTPKQEMFLSDKPLPTEPEEQKDDLKEQHEEDMYEPDFGDDQKEVEQDLPVSNFLMNLILGKESNDVNGHSESEAETKQEETRDDNSCLIIPKQEESLVLPPAENNVEDKIYVEQEKKDAKCSEETHEMIEEKSHHQNLGTEKSLETDLELNKNSHDLELPPYQDKIQNEISNEILSEDTAEELTEIEAKDTAVPNIKQDDLEVGPVCQKNTEATTKTENRSSKTDLDYLNNTKASEEISNTKASEDDTLEKRQPGLLPECLNDNISANAVSHQTFMLQESGMTHEKSLPNDADHVQNPVCEIQDKTTESSSIGAASIPDIQVESEEDNKDEKQPATTATGEVAKEHLEISNDNPQKSIGPEATSLNQETQTIEEVNGTKIALGPEATSLEQEPQTIEKVNDTKIALHENEISEGSSLTFMDKKEDPNISVKGIDNIQTDGEIQADDSDMNINQDKQEAAENKTKMESEKLDESNIQEQQRNGNDEKSHKECHEEDQQFSAKKETLMKEENAHETVKGHTETVKINSNDEQELLDSKIQERDFNVLSPKDVRESEESFVEVAKPEFSTDEEQSPKANELDSSEQKIYEEKKIGEEKIKNFTDEEMKTEAREAGQKAERKKQNLLFGVGSKVKHQLAKVKKAITGKPGRTKPESPK